MVLDVSVVYLINVAMPGGKVFRNKN